MLHTYHWVFDNCYQRNHISPISEILQNLDLSFDFLLLHRLQVEYTRFSLSILTVRALFTITRLLNPLDPSHFLNKKIS